jgi:hypothetical protein
MRTLFSLLAVVALGACSSEDQIVGEWEAQKPFPAHITIQRGASSTDDFYSGFTQTYAGQTYHRLWRIKSVRGRDILYLSAGAGAGGGMQSMEGMTLVNAQPFPILDLGHDRLILEWDNAGMTPRERYEFHRIK